DGQAPWPCGILGGLLAGRPLAGSLLVSGLAALGWLRAGGGLGPAEGLTRGGKLDRGPQPQGRPGVAGAVAAPGAVGAPGVVGWSVRTSSGVGAGPVEPAMVSGSAGPGLAAPPASGGTMTASGSQTRAVRPPLAAGCSRTLTPCRIASLPTTNRPMFLETAT